MSDFTEKGYTAKGDYLVRAKAGPLFIMEYPFGKNLLPAEKILPVKSNFHF